MRINTNLNGMIATNQMAKNTALAGNSMEKLSTGYSYMGIGVLSTYIGIQNLILLNWGQRTGKMPAKIAYLTERHGNNKGLIQYVIVNILLFLLLGLAVVYSSWQLL